MTKKRDAKRNYTVRSVANALDLLEQFQGDDAEISLSDMSRRLQLCKNNVFRLLATLQSRNFVEQNASTDKYRLGFKTVELGQTAVRKLGHFVDTRSIMESLVKECNETACMSILQDLCTVNLDVVECNHPLRVIPRIGDRLPAYCTASGKLQMAYLAEEALREYMNEFQLQQRTPYTITSPKRLHAHLRQIAEQGYAIEDQELDLGVKCVAAPIRDYSSRILGAIALMGPAQRFDDERIKNTIVPLVVKGAARISGGLGFIAA